MMEALVAARWAHAERTTRERAAVAGSPAASRVKRPRGEQRQSVPFPTDATTEDAVTPQVRTPDRSELVAVRAERQQEA
jgi:hypothetical protein